MQSIFTTFLGVTPRKASVCELWPATTVGPKGTLQVEPLPGERFVGVLALDSASDLMFGETERQVLDEITRQDLPELSLWITDQRAILYGYRGPRKIKTPGSWLDRTNRALDVVDYLTIGPVAAMLIADTFGSALDKASDALLNKVQGPEQPADQDFLTKLLTDAETLICSIPLQSIAEVRSNKLSKFGMRRSVLAMTLVAYDRHPLRVRHDLACQLRHHGDLGIITDTLIPLILERKLAVFDSPEDQLALQKLRDTRVDDPGNRFLGTFRPVNIPSEVKRLEHAPAEAHNEPPRFLSARRLGETYDSTSLPVLTPSGAIDLEPDEELFWSGRAALLGLLKPPKGKAIPAWALARARVIVSNRRLAFVADDLTSPLSDPLWDARSLVVDRAFRTSGGPIRVIGQVRSEWASQILWNNDGGSAFSLMTLFRDGKGKLTGHGLRVEPDAPVLGRELALRIGAAEAEERLRSPNNWSSLVIPTDQDEIDNYLRPLLRPEAIPADHGNSYLPGAWPAGIKRGDAFNAQTLQAAWEAF